MSKDVERLWELQQVLSQLTDREKQLEVKPEAFAAIDSEYDGANQEMQKLQESLEEVAKERRRVEGELSDQQEVLKKYQGTLMQVKNQQQYAAAWKEIDAARKHVKDLEDAELKSLGESEVFQKQLDERNESYGPLKERYDVAHAEWQASLADLRDEIEQLRAKQQQIESGLPEPVKREFYRIARQRGGLGMSVADGDTCNACRTRIRPALAQRLKRGELVHCEGCHRMLYMERPTS